MKAYHEKRNFGSVFAVVENLFRHIYRSVKVSNFNLLENRWLTDKVKVIYNSRRQERCEVIKYSFVVVFQRIRLLNRSYKYFITSHLS